ncbi:MAG: alpha-L-fucosidase, partial [Halanaerobiaceae bacterium]
YKSPKQVLAMLVDIVSKNGNLLLNVPQLPDGSIDEECRFLLEQLAEWMKINGEGIFASTPWNKFGEGPTSTEGGEFNEDALDWTEKDFRFTQKGDKLYAFQMNLPEENRASIKSLSSNNNPEIKKVSLMGYDGNIKFNQNEKELEIKLPEDKASKYIQCLCIEFN